MSTKRKKKWSRSPERPASERGETLYTQEEAADYLGVRPRWFHSNNAREVTRIYVGGHLRFRKADLDAYIESQAVSAEK